MNRYVVLMACAMLLLLLGTTGFKSSESLLVQTFTADTSKWPSTFSFGKVATEQQIDSLAIAILPDGTGLPPGLGTPKEGKAIYVAKCASCHGANGKAAAGEKLPAPDLASDSTSKIKAIGNYWPYATTIFDYVRRAMPYNAPGSLTNNEVYSITAYLLSANNIIKPDMVINAHNLYKVNMPARKLFVPDDRRGGPEVR